MAAAIILTTAMSSGNATTDADTFEPDNLPRAANILVDDTPEQHTLTENGDVDWFLVLPEAGNRYQVNIEVEDEAGSDVTVELFDENGTLLAYDDDRGVGLGAYLEWRAINPEYYLKVKTHGHGYGRFDDTAGGFAAASYEISLTSSLNEPPTIVGPIAAHVSARAGQPFSASFLAVDPEGDDLRYDFDWGDESRNWGASTTREHVWTTPGDYCLRVRSRDIYGASSGWTGCFNVKVQFSNDALEPAISGIFCTISNNGFDVQQLSVLHSADGQNLAMLENPHGNAEKPWLIPLSNGHRAMVYTAHLGTESSRSVIFRVIDTGFESVVFDSPPNPPGHFFHVMYARGIQRSNGNLVIAFARTDLIGNLDRSQPAQTVVHVMTSNDLGRTWKEASIVASDDNEIEWSGIWQGTPFDLNKDTLALIAIEQRYRADPRCLDTGRYAYRDDTVVLFKSFDDGLTWPWKVRVNVGPCGFDHNEPVMARLPGGGLIVVFHQGKSGDLLSTTSTDWGANWSTAELVVPGDDSYENRYASVEIVNGRATVLYRKKRRDGSNPDDFLGISQRSPSGSWSEVSRHYPPAGSMMCKLN